jgi:RNA polymerase sigma factor (sigma-70 family)
LDIVLYCETKGGARFACAPAGRKACLEGLLQEHENLVWAVMQAQHLGLAEYADVMQEGRIGCWRAIQYYQPARGLRFSTLAWRLIQLRVWDTAARATKPQGYLAVEEGQSAEQEVVERWQASQLREALETGLASLPEQQRQVIELHAGWQGEKPQTFAEIGKKWGVTRQRINQIHTEALLCLRTPGLSLHLRQLYEKDSREDYRETLRKNWAWQRMYRGRK